MRPHAWTVLVGLLLATASARAEFRRVDLTIFGMD